MLLHLIPMAISNVWYVNVFVVYVRILSDYVFDLVLTTSSAVYSAIIFSRFINTGSIDAIDKILIDEFVASSLSIVFI